MLHSYEKSAIKVEVLARKSRGYVFKNYSAKCIVEKSVGLSAYYLRFTDAVLYCHNQIAKLK